MKVRIRFSKDGCMKYIGHLDVMRYFQKALRRDGLPVSYTQGYHPHPVMSFASPLGIGVTSEGEYMDIGLDAEIPAEEIKERLQGCMSEDIAVLSAVILPEEQKTNIMAEVSAADYLIRYQEGCRPETADLAGCFERFLGQSAILVRHKTKTKEEEIDIRSKIYAASLTQDGILLRLSSGSSFHLKPETVMLAFHEFAGFPFRREMLSIRRLELYKDGSDGLLPLGAAGKENHE